MIIQLIVYDWSEFEKDVGQEDAEQLRKEICVSSVLQVREVNESKILTWSSGVPDAVSMFGFRELWEHRYQDNPELREKLNSLLSRLANGDYVMDYWPISDKFWPEERKSR